MPDSRIGDGIAATGGQVPLKVTVDDGLYGKLFIADGNSVHYQRDVSTDSIPRSPGQSWAKKTTTKHTVTWETTDYE